MDYVKWSFGLNITCRPNQETIFYNSFYIHDSKKSPSRAKADPSIERDQRFFYSLLDVISQTEGLRRAKPRRFL